MTCIRTHFINDILVLLCEKNFCRLYVYKRTDIEYRSKAFRLMTWIDFPHTSHGKGFSPVCVRMCCLNWLFCAHLYSQWLHEYGRSPVWERMCFIKSFLLINPLLQCIRRGSRSQDHLVDTSLKKFSFGQYWSYYLLVGCIM